MRALGLLFPERRATFRGRYVRFQDVECFPKPVQDPLPIYAGGNHPEVRRRAGEYAEGWMPAVLAPPGGGRGVGGGPPAGPKGRRGGSPDDIPPQIPPPPRPPPRGARRRFPAPPPL